MTGMNAKAARWKSELMAMAHDQGARAFGVADLDRFKPRYPTMLQNVGGDYSRAVVVGVRLQKAALEGITDRPTTIYFHNYRQANYQLDSIAWMLADRIQVEGYRALAVAASQIIRKEPVISGHISHRHAAWAAGIGHIGRSNLMVHPEYGGQMRYVTVLTDMPLEADEPFVGDCGKCRACVSVCPAGAIKERPEDFDLQACYQRLCENAKIPFVGQHVCGVCVKACAGKRAGTAR